MHQANKRIVQFGKNYWETEARVTKSNIQRSDTTTTATRSKSVDRSHQKECNRAQYIVAEGLIILRIAKA